MLPSIRLVPEDLPQMLKRSGVKLTVPSSSEVYKACRYIAELQLSGNWLGKPIIQIGLALPLNISILQLYCIFLWFKFFPQLSNSYKELYINVLFVRKYIYIYIYSLKQPIVEILFPTSNCQCSLYAKKNPIILDFPHIRMARRPN